MGKTHAGPNPILVVGGTGKTGRRVVDRLTRLGLPVRVGSRSGTPEFDWTDQRTFGPVVRGVDKAYLSYHPDLAFPGAVDAVAALVDTAVSAGVRRFVLLSGRGEEGAAAAEQIVQASGVEWTIVRSAWFAQNFSENFLLEGVLAGEIALPAGDSVEPFLDIDDLADVATAALIDDDHVGRIYELTGPRLLGFEDVADELGSIIGRDITYTPISYEQYLAALREKGRPEDFAELLRRVLDGRNARLGDGVPQALGREPKDFVEFARDAAATGVWTVN